MSTGPEPTIVPVKSDPKPPVNSAKPAIETPVKSKPPSETTSDAPKAKLDALPEQSSKTVADPQPTTDEAEKKLSELGLRGYVPERVLSPVRLIRPPVPANKLTMRRVEPLPESPLDGLPQPSSYTSRPPERSTTTDVSSTVPLKASEAKTTDTSKALSGSDLFAPVVITIPPSQRTRLAETQTVTPCKLTVSDESVTLYMGRSGVAIIVGIDNDREIDGIKATSSSPADVSVRRENIEGVKTRALYVLRSVGDKAGEFQITFEMPCGRKTVTVQVF
jgi:hypothetical protein